MNLTINKRAWRSAALAATCLAFLTACQGNKSKPEEQHQDLPKVENKYDDKTRVDFYNRVAQDNAERYEGLVLSNKPILTQPDKLPQGLYYDSGIHIEYPEDGVKGVYLTADNVANEEYLNYIIDYINKTDLNAVVIDFKDDHGNIVTPVDSDNSLIQENVLNAVDLRPVLKKLEENNIYPIARIVTFKDYLLSSARPDLSFHSQETGEIWEDGNGARFTNPFNKEVWDYNVQIAIEAAKMGFKDIQFDYIRFPEGFETFADEIEYDIGDYQAYLTDDPEKKGYERVAAINDFLVYANQRLASYGVDLSADVFGYTAIAGDAPDVRGIGQNFAQMAERVDAISSMIYPSHWGTAFFGYEWPDLYPYEIVDEYMQHEIPILENLDSPVTSRPWLQDFTLAGAPGTYLEYGPEEVQAQINALYQHGIHEFLLWNALGEYTEGVDYSPDIEPGSLTPEDSQSQIQ
ncbi:putative glycoside hydrolase [Hutsoniella sourekii]